MQKSRRPTVFKDSELAARAHDNLHEAAGWYFEHRIVLSEQESDSCTESEVCVQSGRWAQAGFL